MQTIGERVKYHRTLLGLTQKAVGDKIGISQQALEKIEAGSTKRPRKLLELADALEVSAEYLQYGTGQSKYNTHIEHPRDLPEESSKGIEVQTRDLPIYGQITNTLSSFLYMDDKAIDYCSRPPQLWEVNNAFGVYMYDDSMLPKYSVGDLIYISPNTPVKPGRFVLLITKDKVGMVRRFIEWKGEELIVQTLSPSEQHSYHRSELERVALIIGSMDS